MIDCKNYVITHKECDVQEDNMYRILCVGDYRKEGLLTERSGDNISAYNARINECTGLYWIWKNTSSEYVGMCHYRRWFYNCRYVHDKSRLDADRVEELLKDHDIILANKVTFAWTVGNNCSIELGQDINEVANYEFFDLIRERQPDYLDDYCDVMDGHSMYVYNMFVTRREILNDYCEWLFSFLLDAADRLDIVGLSQKQQRIAGYYAEMMWTVWMHHQNLKVCEQPCRMLPGGAK